MPKKGYSLVEILIVVVVVGILIALALPNYGQTKEKVLDREAKATLSLVRAAEKIYKMEQRFYYPYNTTYSTPAQLSNINQDLKLSIPSPTSPNWNYSITGDTTGTTGTAKSVRTTTSRECTVDFTNDNDPGC